MSLLEIENLVIRFPGQPRPAVDGVSLRIAEGETLGIVGESGSGKSLTAMALTGLAPPAAEVTGTVRWRGAVCSPAALARLCGREIGIVFQEPAGCLNPLMTVGAQIAEIPGRRAGVGSLLAEVGLDPALAARHPHALSGGQQQRAMIAIALAGDPLLLIADEPTTALDMTVQAQILALLAELRARRGMALLFISHDLDLIAALAGRVAVMQAGRVVEEAATAALFTAPVHPHTKALLAAHRLPALRNPAVGDATVLACEEIRIDYPGRFPFGAAHRAVSAASFALHAGETLGLVGESGSGKSSIARAVMGLLPVAAGRIALFGTALPRRRQPGHARCQIVFQDSGGSLNPRLTVGRIIAEPLDLRGLHRGAARAPRLDALMREVGLDPALLRRYPHQLSGGQRQRVNIARALALDPDVLLCDEIVSALDATVQAQILALLAAIQARRQLAMLFISHDLAVIRAVAHRVAVMQHGRIVETAETEALFAHPTHPTTQRLLAARLAPPAARTAAEMVLLPVAE
jgi:ABC-type glutathione transport system ATPase component